MLALPALIATLWGISPVIHRFLLKYKGISQELVLIVSSITYFVAVLIYTLVRRGAPSLLREARAHTYAIPILATTTLLALFFSNIVYLNVVKNTKDLNISNLVMAMYPLVTLVLAALFLKESMNPKTAIGFFMVLAGLAVIIYSSPQNT